MYIIHKKIAKHFIVTIKSDEHESHGEVLEIDTDAGTIDTSMLATSSREETSSISSYKSALTHIIADENIEVLSVKF